MYNAKHFFFSLDDEFVNFYSEQNNEEQMYFPQKWKWPGGHLPWNN